MPTDADTSEPWFQSGLRFGCTGCGKCCTVEGYVWLDRRDLRRLAKHLGVTRDEFGERYVRKVGRRHSLIEIALPSSPSKKACVFWDGQCTVYEARPRQCRTYPFWKENLATPETWAEEALLSPGIDNGRLYQLGEIQSLLDGKGET